MRVPERWSISCWAILAPQSEANQVTRCPAASSPSTYKQDKHPCRLQPFGSRSASNPKPVGTGTQIAIQKLYGKVQIYRQLGGIIVRVFRIKHFFLLSNERRHFYELSPCRKIGPICCWDQTWIPPTSKPIFGGVFEPTILSSGILSLILPQFMVILQSTCLLA